MPSLSFILPLVSQPLQFGFDVHTRREMRESERYIYREREKERKREREREGGREGGREITTYSCGKPLLCFVLYMYMCIFYSFCM